MLFKNIRHPRSFASHSNKHLKDYFLHLATVSSGASGCGVPQDASWAWGSESIFYVEQGTLNVVKYTLFSIRETYYNNSTNCKSRRGSFMYPWNPWEINQTWGNIYQALTTHQPLGSVTLWPSPLEHYKEEIVPIIWMRLRKILLLETFSGGTGTYFSKST